MLAGPRSGSRLCRLLCCVHWNIDFSVCVRRLRKNQYFSSSSTAQGSVMEPACRCNVRGPPSAIEFSQKMAVCFPMHCSLQREGRGLRTLVYIRFQDKVALVLLGNTQAKLESDTGKKDADGKPLITRSKSSYTKHVGGRSYCLPSILPNCPMRKLKNRLTLGKGSRLSTNTRYMHHH